MQKITRKILAALFAFNLFFFYLPVYFPSSAEELIDRAALQSTITQEATSQTSQINSQPAPSTSSTSQVTNSGNNTSTDTSSSSNADTTVNNNNSASVDQTVNASANTGNNEASRNISIGGNAGVITTGDATVNTLAFANTNSNETAVGGGGGGAASSSTVINTGDNLSTSSSASSTMTTLLANNNTTYVNQTTNADANTGNNRADRNISIGGNAGVITTGNASVNTNYLVTSNGNVVLVGGDSNGNGPGSGASIIIANSGNRGVFNAGTNETNFIIVENSNRAVISQMCGVNLQSTDTIVPASACTANTGGNTSDRNIGQGADSGIINTGDAQVNVIMLASANSNNTAVCDTGGVSGSSDITNTGNDVDINNQTSNNNSTQVNNDNSANVNQTVNAVANTGNNHANRNISIGGNAGVITTGNATVNVLAGADVNQNQTTVCPATAASVVSPPPSPAEPLPSSPPPASSSSDVVSIASSQSSSTGSNNDPVSSATLESSDIDPVSEGQVLGIFATNLPTTGSDQLILGLLVSLSALIIGLYIKNYQFSQERR